MNFINHDILSGEIVPVLLGASPEGARTARRFFKKYRVLSHVFCDHAPVTLRLSCCIKLHTVKHTAGDDLMVTALTDFANALGQADVILYLIPCSPDYANLIWRNREALECHFVIADQPEMERVWFGEETRKEETGI